MRKNMVGNVYERLKVEALLCSHKYKRLWLCKCLCGNITTLETRDLFRIKSCGCLLKENKGVKRTPAGNAALNQLRCQYRIGASKRGLDWLLSDEQFKSLVLSDCFYCGSSPNQTQSKYGKNKKVSDTLVHNGVDRVKNDLGYTEQNSVSCCKICNYAKHILSYAEFVNWLLKAAQYQVAKISTAPNGVDVQ